MNNQNLGHRSRLKERYLTNGLGSLADYEVVELLLTLGTPRKDCKPMAKDLINRLGSLNNILEASTEQLAKTIGIGSTNIIAIRLFKDLFERYFKNKTEQKNNSMNTEDMGKYLIEKIGKSKKEHFVILYMDTKNRLIFDDVSVGILNASLVHPREVFSKAVSNAVSHIIISHNHPSGDLTPSSDDVLTTKRLVEAGKILGITIIDHIIVSKDSFCSLKQLNLL